MARRPLGVLGGTYVQVKFKDKRRKMMLESRARSRPAGQ